MHEFYITHNVISETISRTAAGPGLISPYRENRPHPERIQPGGSSVVRLLSSENLGWERFDTFPKAVWAEVRAGSCRAACGLLVKRAVEVIPPRPSPRLSMLRTSVRAREESTIFYML